MAANLVTVSILNVSSLVTIRHSLTVSSKFMYNEYDACRDQQETQNPPTGMARAEPDPAADSRSTGVGVPG